MSLNLEGRVRALEGSTHAGYRTWDQNGNVVIDSVLPAPDWFQWVQDLIRDPQRREEKAELLWKLRVSAGKDSCGGLLYQYFSSCIDLPVEKLAELAELALTNHGCHRREMKTMLYEFLRGFVREEELGDYKPPDSAPGGGKK